MLSNKDALSRKVFKSGNIHLVDMYMENKIIGQVQLPADENNQNVICLITDDGYLELLGLRDLEGLNAKQHYSQIRQHDDTSSYLEYGSLKVTHDVEELFILVNNVPILSMSYYNLNARYPSASKACSKLPSGDTIYVYGIHPNLRNHVPKIDITQMAGDMINRFHQQIPTRYQVASSH